jgi:TonB-linked SusC/RagA family outer membrane protein
MLLHTSCILVMAVLLLLPGQVKAQANRITGTVTGKASEPLVGATVMVKQTKKTTVTDEAGKFSVEATPGQTLVITIVGYETKEIKVSKQTNVAVALTQTTTTMEDLVVVGYGTQRKKDLTGAVSVVNVGNAKKTASYDVAKMLQGQVPGVTVHGSGEPGGYVQIKIRGVSTYGQNNPLFVIDGVEISAPFDFSPDDIESIQVLKDASATAIYGFKGAPGVVIITTKKGKAGKPQISYNGYAGMQNVPKMLDVTDAAGYRKITNQAELNAGLSVAPGNDPANASYIKDVNTNWQKEGFKTGIIQDHSLRVSGGNESSTYSISLGDFNQTSAYNGPQKYHRNTLNIDLGGKRGILTYGTKFNYTQSHKINPYNSLNSHAVFGGTVTSLVTAIPTMPVYDAKRLRGYGGSDNATQRAITLNVIGMNAIIQNTSDRNRMLGDVWAAIEPVKNLTYKLNVSYDRTDSKDFAFEPTFDLGWYYLNTNSFMSENKGIGYTSRIENTLNYKFNKGKHKVELLGGYIFAKNHGENTYASGIGLLEPYFYTFSAISNPANKSVSSGLGNSTEISYLGRLNYNYDDRYLLTGNFRRDASSKFSPLNQWGNFSSASAAWNIHNEKFIHLPKVISTLKLRSGYGTIGNQAIPDYLYQSYINTSAAYLFNGTLAPGSTTTYLADPTIKWEDKTTTNAAIEIGLFNEKLKFTAEYFHNKSTDILVDRPISLGIGSYPWTVTTNAASFKNEGVEFTLQYHNTKGKLTYDINANVHTVKNTVLAIAGDQVKTIDGNASRTEVGRSIGELYGYVMKGIFQNAAEVAASPTQTNAAPGDVKFQDTNGDGKINGDDRVYLGRTIPNLYYGLNVTLNYEQFDFSMFWQGNAGNKVYNGIYHDLMGEQYSNHSVDALNFWTPTNTNTNIPRPVIGDPNANGRASDRFVQNGSYVKLQNLQLGYTLPKLQALKWLSSARVYISGQNVLTLTKYKGYDPDFISDGLLSRGFDIGSFPNTRTFMAGVQIAL